MNRTNKRHISLKWSMTALILVCWLLPIVILTFATSYFVFDSIRERTSDSIEYSIDNAVKLTQSRLDSATEASRNATYNTVIKDAYNQYRKDYDRTKRYDTVSDYIKQQYQLDEKFNAVGLYFIDDPDTIIFTTNSLRPNSVMTFRQNTQDEALNLASEKSADIYFYQKDGNIYMLRNMLDRNYKPYAVLCAELNNETMFSNIQSVAMSTGASVWINDTSLVLFGDPPTDEMLAQAFESGEEYGSIKGEDSTMYFGTIKADDYEFKYLLKADDGALLMQTSGFYRVIILIAIGMLPLLACVIVFFHFKVNKPIQYLTEAAKDIEMGNFGSKVEGNINSAEFCALADCFDSMSDKLKNQFERLYKEELALRDAQIMALQLQINPHFLNNTLENINWEARLAGNTKVSKMLESLSVMLSASMDRKNQRLVQLSEEMSYVDAYMHIITERMGKRLTVKKEIDPRLMSFSVPRLIMQPVIENAVEHGIQPTQNGEIILRAYINDTNVVLEVENDGVMTQQDIDNIQRLLDLDDHTQDDDDGNLGIRNVNQRLKIMYGQQSGLQIKMNKNQHTVAQIIIPINQQPQ